MDRTQFYLKQARQRIHSCLEHFVSVNCLGSTTSSSECSEDSGTLASSTEPPTPSDWDEFVTSLKKHCSELGRLDAKGR